jgi:hypothetical protein
MAALLLLHCLLWLFTHIRSELIRRPVIAPFRAVQEQGRLTSNAPRERNLKVAVKRPGFCAGSGTKDKPN